MGFSEILLSPLYFVADPTKRLFFVYILSSVFLGIGTFLMSRKSIFQSVKDLFDLRVWQHPSTKVDVSLLFTNAILKSVLFAGVSLSSIVVTKYVVRNLYGLFPDHTATQFSYHFVMITYTVTSFVFLDFSRFFQHYLFHKIPFLWRFHKIHHSAEVLTPLTLYRTHPVESVVSGVRRVVVVGLVSGAFMFHAQSAIDAYAIIGVNALDFMFNFFGSNLRHSHVWLSFGSFNHIFISPAQHQIHHSRATKHRDKNMGFALSIWDKFFGSFYQVSRKEFLIFGIQKERHKNFLQALKAPFL